MIEFVYAPTMRTVAGDIGPVADRIRIDREDGRGPFGTVAYARPLTKNEIEKWGLSTIEMPRTNYVVYGIRANGNRERLFLWDKEMPGAYDIAVKMANTLEEEFDDYTVTPEKY